MATYETSDESVVVVIGSGAGGGTLANELCQKGVNVVLLEAGKRQSTATYVNDEWASFGQLAWTDKRTTSGTWRVARDFPNLPAWTCKTVGGTTTHWAGSSLRIPRHRSTRPAPRVLRHAHRARRCRQGFRRGLLRQGRQGAAPEGARGVRRLQLHRDGAAAPQLAVDAASQWARELVRPGRTELPAAHDRFGLRHLRQAGAHVARNDHGGHRHRRVRQQSEARVHRRLRDGNSLPRPALHGCVPQSWGVGTRVHLGDGRVREHGRHVAGR